MKTVFPGDLRTRLGYCDPKNLRLKIKDKRKKNQ